MSLDFREALSVIQDGSSGFESNVYIPILQECMNNQSVSQTQMIHAHIIKTGTFEDLYLMTFVVNVYGKCGAMDLARKLFDDLPKKNVVTWTSLMSGYIQSSEPMVAIQVFSEMLEDGTYPTNYTLGVVLHACTLLLSVKLGEQLHGFIVKYQVEDDTSIGNALSCLYSKCRSLDSAVKAFSRTGDKNVISWTTAISACGDNGDSVMGLSLFTEMLYDGIEPNEYTFTSVLKVCCVMQAMGVGSQVHSLSIKLGYQNNIPVTNSIMYLYLKCGLISEAKKLFEGMGKISLVTWNAMIAGHAKMMEQAVDSLLAHSSGMEALNIFKKLNRSNMKPDLFTYSSVLTVCSALVALEQGEQLHAQTIKSGFLSDVVVGTALLNMYNKCGSIEKACKAFVEMSIRTMISWTSMITAFSQHGHSQQALQLFEDMRLAGVRPNKITFVAVLSACSHAGMVDEGLAYFKLMKNEYKIKPVMDHYACLIDMYVRLGQLDEAFDFIKKMEFEPNEFIWSNLIAGCRSHGNLELAYYAAEQLLNLNPKDCETYVLLLNMYLSAGKYQDVSRVKKRMKIEKVGKLKDWSWISVRDKVHSFKPDDRLCPPGGEVDLMLADLLEKARTIGYEAQGSFGVTDEEGLEQTTSKIIHHSEKLAVAYGLLNAPNESPIRVIKSISMCSDCHSFIKLISVITEREIIIRDSKRLHKFVNGKCSCGDFGSLM